MVNGNGALVVSRPSHRRLDLVFDTAHAAAQNEAKRHEEEAAHRERVEHLHDQLADRANQMAKAAQRYGAQLEVVRRLYAKAHQDAARPDITAAEVVMGSALVEQQVAEHRGEMSTILRLFLGENADVKKVIDADLKKIATEIEGSQSKRFDEERN